MATKTHKDSFRLRPSLHCAYRRPGNSLGAPEPSGLFVAKPPGYLLLTFATSAYAGQI